jgi:hypothetical protein
MLQNNTKAVHQSEVRANQETVAKTMNFLLKTLLGIFRLPKTLLSVVRSEEQDSVAKLSDDNESEVAGQGFRILLAD